jgi:sec-independent protein translocase protein TatA
MFNIGHWELLLVVGIILLLFGAPRIPGLARSLGQSITEFKRGMKGIDDESDKPKAETETKTNA